MEPGYAKLLDGIKARVRVARLHAATAVNSELVLLYWRIGRDILARQAEQGWGAKVIGRLARDLTREFPDMRGFSPRNLKIHEVLRARLARGVDCAAGCCTIALGANPRLVGPSQKPGGA